MEKGNDVRRGRSGQAMLIAVLSLGGAIMGATAIAGLLILYQIRATTDSENSAKAIFAADAGVEWSLFNFYCSTDSPAGLGRCPSVIPGTTSYPAPTFVNGATLNVGCYLNYDGSGPTLCSNPAASVAISTAASLDSERSFFLTLVGATTTYP